MKKFPLRKTVLLGVIAVLALVYVLQLTLGTRSRVRNVKVADKIDRIEIDASGKSTVALSLSGDTWTINGKYRADPEKIDNLVKNLESIRVLGNVGNASSSDEVYGLGTESAVTVKAFSSDKLVRALNVGKTGASGAQSYIQMDSSSAVYLVNGNYGQVFGVEAENLRDRSFWNFDPQKVTSVKLMAEGKTFQIVRNQVMPEAGADTMLSQSQWTPVESNFQIPGSFDDEKVKSWIQDMSTIKATKWEADDFPQPKIRPAVEIEIGTGTKIQTLSLYYTDEDESTYISSSSGTDYMFHVSKVNKNRIARTIESLTK